MPGGGAIAIDLAIAFVAEDEKAVTARQRHELREIRAVGHRALRIGRRREIDRRPCAPRDRRSAHRDRAKIRSPRSRADKPARNRRRWRRRNTPHKTDWAPARPDGRRAGPTQRFAASAARNRPSRVPLSTSTSRGGIDGARERVAAVEPLRDGFAESIEPLVHRIAAELIDMGGDHRPDERRNRMLRLADRHADRRLARRHVAQQFAQPHERRARSRARGPVMKFPGGSSYTS